MGSKELARYDEYVRRNGTTPNIEKPRDTRLQERLAFLRAKYNPADTADTPLGTSFRNEIERLGQIYPNSSFVIICEQKQVTQQQAALKLPGGRRIPVPSTDVAKNPTTQKQAISSIDFDLL